MNLRILTTEDPPDAVHVPTYVLCDESFTCLCDRCTLDRRARMRGLKEPRQPWQPKQAA